MTLPVLWAWVQAHALAAWPVLTAILILVLRTRSPAEWVALGERTPRVQGIIRALRGAGFDPVKFISGIVQLVTGRAPPSILAMVATATPEPANLAQQLYEAYGDRVGWRSVTGAQMPAWADLPERIRDAWGASAAAAIDAVTWVPAASVPGTIARPANAPSGRSSESGRASPAALALVAVVGILAALFVGLALQGCPRVTRDPAVPSPPPGCGAGATTCHEGTPWRCGPGGRWSQADRRCDRIGGVCCQAHSALTSALINACTTPDRCIPVTPHE